MQCGGSGIRPPNHHPSPGPDGIGRSPGHEHAKPLPPVLASHTLAGQLLPRVPAGQQPALLPSYFVKFQYSGKMVNSRLYLTFCNLFWTAMIW